jgi:regulator of sigma E protease
MSILSLVLFLAILLVLVIVHEFGHFIVAKWVNMRVDEFAFGFPPRIWSKKKGETTYAVNAIPLGGYVSIWGENGEPNDEAKTHPRAFGNRPWWAQLLVLVAGVTMNMLLAWVIFVGVSFGRVLMSTKDPVYGPRVQHAALVVTDSSAESPAYRAGIVPGVALLRVSAGGVDARLTNASSLVSFIGAHQNDSITITYRRDTGAVASTTIAAVYGIVPDKKAIGVLVDSVGYMQTSPLEAFSIGTERTYEMTKMTLSGLGSLVTSIGQGKNVISELSGPIGIARVVGHTSKEGSASLLVLVALLSINLAIFNILPLPALDGGRMVVVIIESVIRKKIPHKYYSWVNVAGFLTLMLLLLVVSVHDIFG